MTSIIIIIIIINITLRACKKDKHRGDIVDRYIER